MYIEINTLGDFYRLGINFFRLTLNFSVNFNFIQLKLIKTHFYKFINL